MQGSDKGSRYEGVFVGNRGLLHDRGNARSSPLLSLWGPSRSLDKEMRGARDRCRNLALQGRPKQKQVEQGAVWEATLCAARSQANLLHQVVPPMPQRTQGHAPEMGALHTHSQ
jgi:hypothetical protein